MGDDQELARVGASLGKLLHGLPSANAGVAGHRGHEHALAHAGGPRHPEDALPGARRRLHHGLQLPLAAHALLRGRHQLLAEVGDHSARTLGGLGALHHEEPAEALQGVAAALGEREVPAQGVVQKRGGLSSHVNLRRGVGAPQHPAPRPHHLGEAVAEERPQTEHAALRLEEHHLAGVLAQPLGQRFQWQALGRRAAQLHAPAVVVHEEKARAGQPRLHGAPQRARARLVPAVLQQAPGLGPRHPSTVGQHVAQGEDGDFPGALLLFPLGQAHHWEDHVYQEAARLAQQRRERIVLPLQGDPGHVEPQAEGGAFDAAGQAARQVEGKAPAAGAHVRCQAHRREVADQELDRVGQAPQALNRVGLPGPVVHGQGQEGGQAVQVGGLHHWRKRNRSDRPPGRQRWRSTWV